MKEIFFSFLRLGFLGFGGPIALVAQMQMEFIDKRKWQTPEEFAQALTLIKSMPGPLAFSTATYLGTVRLGFFGGLIAGWSLVFPAFVMMIVLASTYDSYSHNPVVVPLLHGMQAAALALIIYSIKGLAQGYFRRWIFWCFLLLSIYLSWQLWPEPMVILGMGLLSLIWSRWNQSFHGKALISFAGYPILFDEKLQKLFWICFKSGAVVFGTGLAMVPALQHGFVTDMGWMTRGQFMDALAFGQMTPGPVLITVTFVGYKVAGLWGAFVATFAIFLASCFHMTTWFPPTTGWLARQKWVGDFVLGALAAVVGTLILTTFKLTTESGQRQIVLTLVCLALLWRWKIPSWALILGGGIAGYLVILPT